MASNLVSTILTDLNASPVVKHDPIDDRGFQRELVGVVAVTTAAETTNSQIAMVRVKSADRVSHIYVTSDQLDSNASPTLAANIGLYNTPANGGAAVSASLFAAAKAIGHSSGTNGPTDILAVAAGSANLRVWELLSLSADPSLEYDLTFTVSTGSATAASGNLAVKVCVVNQA